MLACMGGVHLSVVEEPGGMVRKAVEYQRLIEEGQLKSCRPLGNLGVKLIMKIKKA